MKSVKGGFKKPEAVTADSMRKRATTDADLGGTLYAGRRCTRCNGWIANEALHHCSDTAVSDVRIANALERIAVALERASAQPLIASFAGSDCDPGDCTTARRDGPPPKAPFPAPSDPARRAA